MAAIFEPKPRWPGGPIICNATNLPAFKTKAGMKAFQGSLLSNVVEEWECEHCGCFHYKAKPRGPAGSSSGNERPCEPIPGRYGDKTRPWEKKKDIEMMVFQPPDPALASFMEYVQSF
jgi:hypothetical protein